MRILFRMVIFMAVISWGNFTVAAHGLELDKAALVQEWNEGEETQTMLHLNADGDWKQLKLDLTGKFYLAALEDRYSAVAAKLLFPQLTENLVFKMDYAWDDKYKIYGADLLYNWQPFERIKLAFDYQAEERRPELASGCPYRLNAEGVGLAWEEKPWEYRFKLTRNDKEYYLKYPQYTALKYQLRQEFGWCPLPTMQLQLEYNEDTGDYPAASYKDFWKEEWALKGKHNSDHSKWQYNWEYSKLGWEKGFKHYRDKQQVQFKMNTKVTPATTMILGVNVADLDYYSPDQDYSEPGVYYHPETDLKSRVDSKIGAEFQLEHKPYSWEIGSFIGNTDYDSDLAADVVRMGIYCTFAWKIHQVKLSLKAAPNGDLSRQDAYYQFEIVYKP